MDQRTARQGRTWLAAATAMLVLGVAAPRPGSAVAQLTGIGSAVDPFAPLVAALSLVAWLAALWLAVSVLVTVASSCPGWTGRIGRALSRRLVPAAVRRTLQLSLGLTVAVSALGATTASAAAPTVPAWTSSPASTSSTATPSAPGPVAASLDWPTSAAPTPSPSAGAGAVVTDPVPTVTTPSPSAAPAAPAVSATPLAARPPISTVEPAPAGPDSSRPELPSNAVAPDRRAPAPTSASSVLVRPGDSLWSISRAHLQAGGEAATPADIAHAWPQWWEANRQLMGDDPDLVLPGTQLSPP